VGSPKSRTGYFLVAVDQLVFDLNGEVRNLLAATTKVAALRAGKRRLVAEALLRVAA
jgi:hypothetical protein